MLRNILLSCLLLPPWFCAGCTPQMRQMIWPTVSLAALPIIEEPDKSFLNFSECAKPPEKDRAPLQAPELISTGSAYLSEALYVVSPEVTESRVSAAIDCFSRALRLNPESYEASLGAGIAYLASARLLEARGLDLENYLGGARSMLGHAYMLRHGAYEPLYYLAEVALLEGKTKLARLFLTPLQISGVKEGPVNMLLGRVAEQEGKMQDAVSFYRKSASIGWPRETARYSAQCAEDLVNPRKGVKVTWKIKASVGLR